MEQTNGTKTTSTLPFRTHTRRAQPLSQIWSHPPRPGLFQPEPHAAATFPRPIAAPLPSPPTSIDEQIDAFIESQNLMSIPVNDAPQLLPTPPLEDSLPYAPEPRGSASLGFPPQSFAHTDLVMFPGNPVNVGVPTPPLEDNAILQSQSQSQPHLTLPSTMTDAELAIFSQMEMEMEMEMETTGLHRDLGLG